MDIETRKRKFVQEFLDLQKKEFLALFEELFYSVSTESDEKIKSMNIEELNRGIDQSLLT